MALIRTESVKYKTIIGDYGECPNCGHLENSPRCGEYIGGTDYAHFDDIDGVWFDEDNYDSVTIATCESCNDRTDWNNWSEYNEIYECLECGCVYASEYDAKTCC